MSDDPIRGWLAAVLRGDAAAAAPGRQLDASAVLAAASEAGVPALLHACLSRPELAQSMPPALHQPLARAARVRAAQHMFREHQCRLILAEIAAAGVPVLLLKGSALAYRIYPSAHLRECSDIDLLLPSRQAVACAVAILGTLGYAPRDAAAPGDLVAFEVTCVRSGTERAGLEIDLHWQLSSTPAFAFRYAWAELDASAIALPALAPDARGLAPVPAYLHACMHRVQNMAGGIGDRLKWLYDLHLLGQHFGTDDWQALADQAGARGLAGTCLAGLDAAARCFGGIAPGSVRRDLATAARGETLDPHRMHRWLYIQRMNFLAFPTCAQRMRWLRQRLLPDQAYLRARHGDAGLLRLLLRRLRAGIGRL